MRNFSDWHEIRTAAVAKPPSQKELDAMARRAEEKEGDRLRLRERLKRQLAESNVAENRVEELYSVIAKLEQKKESLASDHVSNCKPIQAELELLRRHQVDRILTGDDADSDAVRRCELQAKIDTYNQQLEKAIRDTDESITPVQIELRATAKGINPTLRNDLTHSASIEKRIAMQVFLARNEFIRRRVEQLSEALRERRQDLLTQAMLADAQGLLADAELLSKAAVDACVAE